MIYRGLFVLNGDPGGARTHDPQIKSLYNVDFCTFHYISYLN